MDERSYYADVGPVWAPTGGRIAFASSRAGNAEIFTARSDGSDVRQLTTLGATTWPSGWSPDGRFLLVESNVSGDRELYALNVADTSMRRLTARKGRDSHGTWSPDASRIFFYSERDGNGDIYSMDPNGGDERRHTTAAGMDVTPVPSPDGLLLAFGSDRTGDREIHVLSLVDGAITRLTDSPGFDGWPQWSPDGTRIVFTSQRRDGVDDIYVMNADGTDVRSLTDTPALDFMASWAPSGDRLVLRSDRDGRPGLFVLSDTGDNVVKITNTTLSDFAVRAWRSGAAAALDALSQTRRDDSTEYFLAREIRALGLAALGSDPLIASRLFEAAVTAYPSSADAYDGLRLAYVASGRSTPPPAEELIDLIRADPEAGLNNVADLRAAFPGWVLMDDTDWIALGRERLAGGETTDGVRILTAGLQRFNDSAPLLVALGDAYLAAGRKNQAVVTFTRAVAANGGDAALDRLRQARTD